MQRSHAMTRTIDNYDACNAFDGRVAKVQDVIGSTSCKHCHGKKMVKSAAGVRLPCPVCRGNGKDALITK